MFILGYTKSYLGLLKGYLGHHKGYFSYSKGYVNYLQLCKLFKAMLAIQGACRPT
jgi:hypothetical protein